jgi:hypothetical protein
LVFAAFWISLRVSPRQIRARLAPLPYDAVRTANDPDRMAFSHEYLRSSRYQWEMESKGT